MKVEKKLVFEFMVSLEREGSEEREAGGWGERLYRTQRGSRGL